MNGKSTWTRPTWAALWIHSQRVDVWAEVVGERVDCTAEGRDSGRDRAAVLLDLKGGDHWHCHG